MTPRFAATSTERQLELAGRLLDEHPGVAIVGAQLLNRDGSFQASYADLPSFTGELLLLLNNDVVLPPHWQCWI